MGNIFTYSGIFAKTKAMSGRLLTDKDFRILADCPTVFEAIQYLKEHPGYREIFKDSGDLELHRGDIEKLLAKGKYQDFASLYRFANTSGRRFLKLYFIHYETGFLKYCLRQLFSGHENGYDDFEPEDFYASFSRLKIKQLLAEKDLTLWISLLDGTSYEKAFAPFKNQTGLTLFDYESALDHHYFRTLWKIRNQFFGTKDGKFLKESLGRQVDLLNIQWIYRGRHKYHLNHDDVRRLLIPLHHRLTEKDIADLVNSETKQEFEQALEATRYQKLFHQQNNQNQSLEKLYYQHLIHVNQLLSKKDPYSPATLNTYLFLKEEEIRVLTILIEGLRYQVPAAELLSYIPLKQEVISP